MTERWLVVSNCQTAGLTNCLQTLARNVQAEACDYWTFSRKLTEDPGHFAQYDLALLLHDAYRLPDFREDLFRRTRRIPSIVFSGYHPDCCYVMANGTTINDGVIGHYQSLIVLGAYMEGLPPERASEWFRADVYERLGYFDQWAVYRDLLMTGFATLGLDMSALFRRVGRGRSFMHSFDHPSIDALFELARAILHAEGQPMFGYLPPPPDNLASTWWPIYPEIGERIGVQGDYLFKPVRMYKPLDLADYVTRSLALFARWPATQLSCQPTVAPRLDALRTMMRGA